jgi:threonine dehydrogenase-like Zn-dependent dehydrogenase
VRALRFHASVPRFLAARVLGKHYPVGALPLALVDAPEPRLLPGWEPVRVRLAGICGSDLGLLFAKQSPRLSPFFSFPAILGHEFVGETGGTRVVVNPLIGCRERGLDPCAPCARGVPGSCARLGAGPGPAGGMLGFNAHFPGGWAERASAHRHRLHPLPDGVPDERAVLSEPLAVVLRGLTVAFDTPAGWSWPAQALVIGAGTIGVLTVRALRALGMSGALHVAARHPAQAQAALAAGASRVHASAWAAALAVGARRRRAIIGPPAWRGGFEAVIESAGSPGAFDQALWTATEGGKVVLLGAPGLARADLSALWFREITLHGSYAYADEDFARAVALLHELSGLEGLVSQVFPLEEWPKAIKAALERTGIKQAFRPGNSTS